MLITPEIIINIIVINVNYTRNSSFILLNICVNKSIIKIIKLVKAIKLAKAIEFQRLGLLNRKSARAYIKIAGIVGIANIAKIVKTVEIARITIRAQTLRIYEDKASIMCVSLRRLPM